MDPLDPRPAWPVVGVTGIPRIRTWDAVVAAEAPGLEGESISFVGLADGRVLPPEAEPLARALDGALARPFRAEGVNRGEERWGVGGHAIDVAELDDDPGGTEVEVVWDGIARSVRVDGEPTLAAAPELEALGAARGKAYVVRARRLAGQLWEIWTTPL